MKRIGILLLAGLLAASCVHNGSNELKMNIDKALKRPVKCAELYAKADVIPLRVPEGFRAGQGETLLEVAADRFFLLNQEKDAILVFDGAGGYVTAIRSAEPVIDFSPYQDRALAVLTEHAITEYAIRDGSFLGSYQIQSNGIDLRCVSRLNENEIYMLGSRDGDAYYCSYFIDRKQFGSEKFPAIMSPVFPASEVQDSRYFHDGQRCLCFLSRSGVAFAYDAALSLGWPALIPDFGKEEMRFTNVQKTGDRFYYAFERDGESGVVVCNPKTRKYQALRKTEEGTAFPLGVVHAGSNYYCCPATRLPEFLPDAPADGGAGLVIIRYALLASDLAVLHDSGRYKEKEHTVYEKSDVEDLLCGTADSGAERM